MAKMKVPEGMNSCSYAGVEYPVQNGYVDVPSHAVADLQSHGLVLAPDAPANGGEFAAFMAGRDKSKGKIDVSKLAADAKASSGKPTLKK